LRAIDFSGIADERRRSARSPERSRDLVSLLKFRKVLECGRSGAAFEGDVD